ncbi:vitelline membrane outer layer protein 1 homolog [Actinia tenebrosa]|uniref:Vitelline membrane outer layer protein 1 homolog n=1 Tax=Actinia tenebrosa TaxID=6105 RepID=A0A6P8HIG6_ACTTE|nr:vitelline membrane outer layer protein 1 homolog [Actinia tenebrosa]
MFFPFALLFFLVITCVTGLRSDYVTSISPHANTGWGSWGRADWCPFGHYAYGFQLKVEGNQGGGDDTAVNGIRLHCRSACHKFGGDITSSVMVWGNWENSKYCSWNNFLMGVSMKSEPHQGRRGDDTAVNNFQFLCQSIYRHHAIHTLTGHGMPWGHWSSPVHCPKNSYICGIKTQVEGFQGRRGDDTALNDAIFYCCRLKRKTCRG